MIVGGDKAKVIEMNDAPAGYVTSSYTTGDITSTTTPTNITVNDVNASSTTFTFYGASQTNWFAITNFTITLAKTFPMNVVLFNLAGQRVAQPSQRGVYIVGGKKVVVK